MPRAGRALLKVLALTVGALFALGVVLTVGATFFFGSSKVRTLFGNSAEALAGPHGHVSRAPTLDAGAFIPSKVEGP